MERKFDLVILDIRIQADGPKEQSVTEDWARSGLHFLKELRDGKFGERTPKDVPVLVITCVVNTSDVDAILEIGNSPGARCLYIAKPTKLDPVVEAVHKLFA
jgi:DNA-binding NarL/FixJ family response regulator